MTHAGWAQRDSFLGALAQTLAELTTRRAYYPGAAARREAFLAAHPEAEELGRGPDDALPWTFIPGVPPGHVDDICFNVESFFGQVAETALPAASPAAFIDAATAFCNDVVWGTLGATLLVSPSSTRDQAVADAVERAVADLRYGSIGVNVWHGLSFALGSTTWGAYPGHPRTDIQSGTGVVGNALMFDRPQKSVRARPLPLPAQATLVRDGTGRLRGHAPLRRLRGRAVGGQDPRAAPGRHAAVDRGGASAPPGSSSWRGAAGWRRAPRRRSLR